MDRRLRAPRWVGGDSIAAYLQFIVLLIGTSLGAVIIARAAAAPTALRLVADVQRSISVKTASGVKVKTLRHGIYVVVIHDRSRVENFHLSAGSPHWLDRKTGRRFVGTVTWRLVLRPDTYTYFSDTHPQTRFRFRVI
jgi:hypothetical protein